MNEPPSRAPFRWVASGIALAAGLAIAWLDTRPGWDDAGITAGLVFLAAGGTAVLGARPSLAAALVALPMIAVEVSGGYGVLIAVPIAVLGAAVGWAIRRATASAGTARGRQ